MATEFLKSQLAVLVVACLAYTVNAQGIGVNWGREASHPLPPPKVVELLKANNIAKVKLFDADPLVLESLSGSNIHVIVGIPNFMLRRLNSSFKAAESWVHENLTRFVSDGASRVLIDYIAVGDEPFLQSYGEQFYPFAVGAAANIQAALLEAHISEKVKVVVPCSSDAFLSESGLPSEGQIRPDVNKTMIELLSFLSRNRSPFVLTISPFQSYLESKNLSLDFALFRDSARQQNDTHRSYKNSFDLSYNTVTVALSNAGFPRVEIIVGRIGWPTDGAANATSSLAEEFLKGLFRHLHSRSMSSPNPLPLPSEVYISSLLDEDMRSTATGNFERHWGVFTFDGQAKYQVDFNHGSRKLVNAQDVQYLSSKWCVINNNEDLSNASALALDACSAADCTEISSGGSCFNLSWPGNISYAFNSYYQQHDQNEQSCNFSGLGLITTVDPSVDTCRFYVGIKTSFSITVHRSALSCWMIPPMVTILSCLLSKRW
ncbi:glucan endo-1,3-beta-glucosidase 9 [Dorcoceras hygrometricum]|uniref:Glucan endo-1,3-beta-glucosidase 9 n=1 Tax=Dorcoceras hygrometricum TaxID=472368 RepID=A0A2Z7B289_9LAMI|nr:glucan endo-1,3-beta-glucosidase 9 [Dorcoceras hygrometricum]